MKKYEFEELTKKFYTIAEAILLYDSGNHSEYNKDDLDEQLDDIHAEIVEAASTIAQHLINNIDNDYNGEVEMTIEDLDNIRYLNFILDMAWACRTCGYSPETLGLTKSYGNDNSMCDPEFYVWKCRRSEDKYFDYRGFVDLLEKYELIID